MEGQVQEIMEHTQGGLIDELNRRIKERDFDSAQQLFEQSIYVTNNGIKQWDLKVINKNLAILGIAFQIYQREKEENVNTIFDRFSSWDLIIKDFYHLKFLLRRIDFDLREADQKVTAGYILDNQISTIQILTIINYSIIHKVKVLNKLAMLFFNNGHLDKVIPFLSDAYEIEPSNDETNYNLAYVLNYLGETELAKEYIDTVQIRTQSVQSLSDQIKINLQNMGK